MKKEINPAELDFLLRFPAAPNTTSPVDFISHVGWGAIKTLSAMDEFRNLDRDIENNSKRWRKFVEAEAPEKEKFPQVAMRIALDWYDIILLTSNINAFYSLFIVNQIGMEKERCAPKTLHDACIAAG